MCGFVGFWHFNQADPRDISGIAKAMAAKISHRGPDSSGVWVDSDQPFALAHQRLAIRDLSSHGAQPMHSSCGRWVIAYNGEIYNTDELIKQLAEDGVHIRGHSDTEVLLQTIAAWGIDKALAKSNGMFAFALWDKKDKKLYLARDRIGIKPLYWGFNHNTLYFGSQLKAFKAHPMFKPVVNKDAMASYFRFNYLSAPLSIYEDINKLSPGEYVVIETPDKMVTKQYWSPINKPVLCKSDDVVVDLHKLLKDAVKKRMVADVPLGAFLSGGIDSSLVVSLMQSQSTKPIRTFSIGFNEAEFNEAQYAKKVAQHLGTDHYELYLSDKDAIDLIPEIPVWYDEPFADASQLPTLLVSKLARQHVTVSLSGDGGDELFAGYNRYFLGNKINKQIARLPAFSHRWLAKCILSIKPGRWDSLAQMLPTKFRVNQLGDKAHKLAALMQGSKDNFYQQLVSLWQHPEDLVLGSKELNLWPELTECDFVRGMQLLDTMTYLPDDILTKVDRASMAVSLEARVPLLDHRVAEKAFSLSTSDNIQGGKGKLPLRQILSQYVPNHLIDRPKMGFGVPVGDWLRGPLRDWAESLLAPQRLIESGLNKKMVLTKWQEHLSGNRNWQYPLWGVLMYQAWNECA